MSSSYSRTYTSWSYTSVPETSKFNCKYR